MRKHHAAETRMRVLDAAAACFSEHGYSGTTLRDIARTAGVSLDTVQVQGAKARLLLDAFDLVLVGQDQALPLREQPASELREAFAADTLEDFLAPLCVFLTDSNRRSAPLWQAYVGAAASDDQLADAYAAKMDAMRADGMSSMRLLISRGLVEAPASLEELVDELWLVAHVAQYSLLVGQAGWSEEHYLAWLTERMLSIVRRHCG